jgi:GntR family transcriptional regulator
MIQFRLNTRSGVPTYLQLVQQVRQAIMLGLLLPGDQLPTVKEAVGQLTINPNTVLKAYRALEYEGLVLARRGQGTFVAKTLRPPPPDEIRALRLGLERWLAEARRAGLDEESIAALYADAVRASFTERVA